MAARAGWDPEPMFGDALSGSGGTSDPIDREWPAVSLIADFFPDALSASLPAGSLPAGSPSVGSQARGTVTAAPVPSAAPQIPGSGVPPAHAMPDRAGPPPPAQWRTAPGQLQRPPGGRVAPSPPPGRPGSLAAQPLPSARFAAPGQPAAQYVPVPTSAELAPGPGRRPTAGLGYTGGARPVPARAPGEAVRPPAYLPAVRGRRQDPGAVPGSGTSQVRAALQQARQSSGQPAAAVGRTRKKSSGAWGCLVFLGILLFSSGAAQKVISAISELLQRK